MTTTEKKKNNNFSHKIIQLEDDSTYALLGLDADQDYTEEELCFWAMTPVTIYPEGMLFDFSKLDDIERQRAKKKMVSLMNKSWGYNWNIIQDFILAFYKAGIRDVLKFVASFFDDFYNSKSVKYASDFQTYKCQKRERFTDRYGDAYVPSGSLYKDTNRLYNTIANVDRLNYHTNTMMIFSKICALFFISPEILWTGRGKLYGLHPSVTEQKNFSQKLENYKKKVMRDFSNSEEVEDMRANLNPTLKELKYVCGYTEKSDHVRDFLIHLTKEDIANWMGISPSEILEVKAVIPFSRECAKKQRLEKVNKILKS